MDWDDPHRLLPVGSVTNAMPDSIVVGIQLDICHSVCSEYRTLISV